MTITARPSLHARRAAWLALPGAAAIGIALWDPARRGGFPLCPVRALSGHSCPGCGLTRSLGSLLRGRFGEAVTLHPLLPVLVLEVMLAAAVVLVLGDRVATRVPRWFVPGLLALNGCALAVTWVIRTSTGQIAVLS
jgi:Protein of unknown function (DUF2752)